MEIKKRTLYFYREFGRFFAIVFCVLSFIFMIRPLLWLMDLIISNFFSPASVIKFFLYSMLGVSPDILSLSFFIALLGVVARMNMDREYWVFLTAGIPGRNLLKQMFLPTFIFVLLEFACCFYIVPGSIYAGRSLMRQSEITRPFKYFRSRTIITDFPGTSIYVGEVSGGKMKDISIVFQEGEDTTTTINAGEGRLAFDRAGKPFIYLINGSMIVHSIRASKTIVNSSFKGYSFPLNFSAGNPSVLVRKIAELRLGELVKAASGSDSRAGFEFNKKIFMTILPIFYLFLGFYTGLGIRMSNLTQIVGVGAILGLLSYFLILLGQGLVMKTGNAALFWIVPLIFSGLSWYLRRRFSHVT